MRRAVGCGKGKGVFFLSSPTCPQLVVPSFGGRLPIAKLPRLGIARPTGDAPDRPEPDAAHDTRADARARCILAGRTRKRGSLFVFWRR